MCCVVRTMWCAATSVVVCVWLALLELVDWLVTTGISDWLVFWWLQVLLGLCV